MKAKKAEAKEKVKNNEELKNSEVQENSDSNESRVFQEKFENNLLKEESSEDMTTEVYDEAEIASALELGFLAQALERHKDKMKPETHPDFDGENCLDCETPIPLARLKMFKIRCVDCQSALEQLQKRRG